MTLRQMHKVDKITILVLMFLIKRNILHFRDTARELNGKYFYFVIKILELFREVSIKFDPSSRIKVRLSTWKMNGYWILQGPGNNLSFENVELPDIVT